MFINNPNEPDMIQASWRVLTPLNHLRAVVSCFQTGDASVQFSMKVSEPAAEQQGVTLNYFMWETAVQTVGLIRENFIP